jgi:hypothetical protein
LHAFSILRFILKITLLYNKLRFHRMVRYFYVLLVLHVASVPLMQGAFSLSGLCPGAPPALLRTVATQPRWRDTLRRSMPLLAIIGATCATAYILAEYTGESRSVANELRGAADNANYDATRSRRQSIANPPERSLINPVNYGEPEKMQIDAASHDSVPEQLKNLTVENNSILSLPRSGKRYSLQETIQRFKPEVCIAEVITPSTFLCNLPEYNFPEVGDGEDLFAAPSPVKQMRKDSPRKFRVSGSGFSDMPTTHNTVREERSKRIEECEVEAERLRKELRSIDAQGKIRRLQATPNKKLKEQLQQARNEQLWKQHQDSLGDHPSCHDYDVVLGCMNYFAEKYAVKDDLCAVSACCIMNAKLTHRKRAVSISYIDPHISKS